MVFVYSFQRPVLQWNGSSQVHIQHPDDRNPGSNVRTSSRTVRHSGTFFGIHSWSWVGRGQPESIDRSIKNAICLFILILFGSTQLRIGTEWHHTGREWPLLGRCGHQRSHVGCCGGTRIRNRRRTVERSGPRIAFPPGQLWRCDQHFRTPMVVQCWPQISQSRSTIGQTVLHPVRLSVSRISRRLSILSRKQ